MVNSVMISPVVFEVTLHLWTPELAGLVPA